MSLPTTCVAVEAYIRARANPRDLEQIQARGREAYAYLFGMATAMLAEANREIEKLRLALEEKR